MSVRSDLAQVGIEGTLHPILWKTVTLVSSEKALLQKELEKEHKYKY